MGDYSAGPQGQSAGVVVPVPVSSQKKPPFRTIGTDVGPAQLTSASELTSGPIRRPTVACGAGSFGPMSLDCN